MWKFDCEMYVVHFYDMLHLFLAMLSIFLLSFPHPLLLDLSISIYNGDFFFFLFRCHNIIPFLWSFLFVLFFLILSFWFFPFFSISLNPLYFFLPLSSFFFWQICCLCRRQHFILPHWISTNEHSVLIPNLTAITLSEPKKKQSNKINKRNMGSKRCENQCEKYSFFFLRQTNYTMFLPWIVHFSSYYRLFAWVWKYKRFWLHRVFFFGCKARFFSFIIWIMGFGIGIKFYLPSICNSEPV